MPPIMSFFFLLFFCDLLEKEKFSKEGSRVWFIFQDSFTKQLIPRTHAHMHTKVVKDILEHETSAVSFLLSRGS